MLGSKAQQKANREAGFMADPVQRLVRSGFVSVY
jgi:hypothetical protein